MATVSSGDPQVGTPGLDGLGNILQGSLETSNVDIVEEMTNSKVCFGANLVTLVRRVLFCVFFSISFKVQVCHPKERGINLVLSFVDLSIVASFKMPNVSLHNAKFVIFTK